MKTNQLETSAVAIDVAEDKAEEKIVKKPTQTTDAVKELSNFELLEIEDGASVVVAQGCLSCS